MQDVAEPLPDEDGWERPDFFDKAKCFNKIELFLPGRGGNNRGGEQSASVSQKAREVCRTCPVFDECFDYAMTIPKEWAGIYAGMSNRTRALIRRNFNNGHITREQAVQLSLSNISRSFG